MIVAKTTSAASTAKKAAPKKIAKRAPMSHGVGRRKKSVARVWLRSGSGKVVVNDKDYTQYFTTDLMKLAIQMPFKAVAAANSYDFEVNVHGGGLQAQAGAARLGISRALVLLDATARQALRQDGLLTVDARVKERKKPGQKAARRKFQFVKR